MTLQLPLKQRLKLLRQQIYSAVGFRGHVPVRIEESSLGATILVEGERIAVPSPLRWKLYKKGWRARLDQLEREYGVGRHVTLGPDSVILDIGANAGEFAHVAARYGAQIFCLEPDPNVFACLKKNTRRLNNVSIHDALVWNEEAELEFFSAPASADSSVFDEGQGPKTTKTATTVERFCRDHGIEKVDLLKCDAEGAEPEVLEGVGSMFPNISAIALDTGAERKGERTNAECAAIIKAHGFTVIDEKIGKRLMTYGIRAA